MKLANMIMILVIIQASIVLFDNIFQNTGYTNAAYVTNSSNDTSSYNTVWSFIADPTGWGSTSFLGSFTGLLSMGAVGAIAVGVYLITKSDTTLFFPIFILLLGFGSIPIYSLWTVFHRDYSIFGCVSGAACPLATFGWVITGGLLAIFYVLSILQWWSGRDTG